MTTADAPWAPVDDLIRRAERGKLGRFGVAVEGWTDAQPEQLLRWERDGDHIVPAASTIKVAILAAVARAFDTGDLTQTQTLAVTDEHKVAGSGILTWMTADLTLPVVDLAYLMIAISDNTASNLLIDAVGINAITRVINDLGLTDTALRRRFLGRYPGPGEPENVTSAVDLTRLMRSIARDEIASAASSAWMRLLLDLQQYRDRLGRNLPDGVSYAGKSGWLPGLSHDAGLLTGKGWTLAISVLARDISDKEATGATIGEIGAAAAMVMRHVAGTGQTT